MRRGALLLGVLASLAVLPARGQTTLVLKSGEHYDLKGKSKTQNGVVSFTTVDGRFLAVKQADIAKEIPTPIPAVTPLDGTDSRKLGEIARQSREERGVSTAVDPKKPPAPPKSQEKARPARKSAPKKRPARPSSPPKKKGPDGGDSPKSAGNPS